MRSLPIQPRAARLRPPAAALVLTGSISGQCGAALATKVFADVGPAGTLTLRLVFAALWLAVLTRPGRADLRRILRSSSLADLAVVVVFGLALAGMNLSFYESIARIPLGVAVTVEFVGPLSISVAGSRRWTDGLWALLAAAGVLLIASGSLSGAVRHLDIAGVGLALLAGIFWACYILLNKQTGQRFHGTIGLTGAMTIGALVVIPIGAAHAGAALLRPVVLGMGAAVALLSSLIPYSCDLAALRRATPRAFGILVSMSPALATLAGLVILGQQLSGLEIGALVLVVAANLGSSWLGTRTAAAATDVPIPPTSGTGSLDPRAANADTVTPPRNAGVTAPKEAQSEPAPAPLFVSPGDSEPR